MTPRPERPSGRDDGFTLIEMIVTVTILGIISAALFGMVIGYLKMSSRTESRLSESTDQQFVSVYWQTDVSSLGRRDFDPDAADPVPAKQSVWTNAAPPRGCGAGVASGTIVVAFAWTEFNVGASDPVDAWDASDEEVAYVSVPSGSQFVLQRVRCSNGAAETPINVAHSLTAVPVVNCVPSCSPAGGLPTRVSLTMSVRNLADADSTGYTTVLTADRRQG